MISFLRRCEVGLALELSVSWVRRAGVQKNGILGISR